MKNYLRYTLYLMLMTVGILLIMGFLPKFSIGGHTMRKVDMLSDLRPKKVIVEDTTCLDSIIPKPKPVFIDTCMTGVTCIEDYSDSTARGMTRFYEALARRDTISRPVRIAYYGDSFIEADIMTGDLRSMLQSEYGGSGVGYVPVSYSMTGFRPTVKQSFSGWDAHSKIDSTGFNNRYQDISGNYAFLSDSTAFTLLRGVKKYAAHLDTCTISSIYFRTYGTTRLSASVNKLISKSFKVNGDGELQEASINGKIGSVQWTIDQCDSATFYGISMESSPGLCLDNFSIRGSSGIHLNQIPLQTYLDFHKLRKYDLIVLQFGLNITAHRVMDYTKYKNQMKTVIDHLKEAFPEAGILLIGIGDREDIDDDGELHTLPEVKALIRFQQAIAAENHIAFYNLYKAMGGEGSIVEMVDKGWANRDYTHINFKGGKHMAGILFESLKYGQKQYERRKAYERE